MAQRNGNEDDLDYDSSTSSSDESTLEAPRKHGNKILDTYLHLSSRRVDLVGDFAGDELFLIEGDSLLLHCFRNALLDYEDGFQMLHASYLIEDYLQQLQQRKCRFHIAFFEAHQKLCIPENVSKSNASKYLLTRAAIIRHLQINLSTDRSDIQIHRFDSVNDDSFVNYLQDSGIYFLMCHDGANHDSGDAALATNGDVPSSNDESPETKIKLRSTILHFIQSGYNVALINGSETVDTKVMAMVLENSRVSKLPSLDIQTKSDATATTDALEASLLEKVRAAGPDLTEREQLVIVSILSLVNTSPDSEDLFKFAYHLLVHTALLHALPISARSLKHISPSQITVEYLPNFNEHATNVLQSSTWSNSHEKSQSICDISDLIDGRLLNAVSSGFAISQMNSVAQKKFDNLVTALKAIREISLDTNEKAVDAEFTSTSTEEHEPEQRLKVLPFSNPVFDKHLASIRLAVDDYAIEETSRPSARVFRELTHWHNAKVPIAPKSAAPVVSAKDEFRARRRNQRFMDEMQKYAASLTNSVGKALEPETLVVKSSQGSSRNAEPKVERPNGKPTKEEKKGGKDDTAKKGGKEDKKGGAKGGKNASKNSGKQALMDSIAATQAKKAEVANSKVLQAWHVTLKNLAAETNLPARYVKTGDYLTTLQRDKRELFGAEVQLYALNTLIEVAIHSSKISKQEQSRISALIWHIAREIGQSENLTKAIAEKIELTISAFKLPPVDIEKPTQDRALPFKFALPLQNSDVPSVKIPSKDFQLTFAGPYLDRTMDSAPDPRVEFEPDGWQRRVLDGIDANRSLFVVAPTSAGKTFISFYAMRKVLEADDEGVLVYVAPTKALVNQIAAEIQARYSKKFKYGGKSVWAIHTRDHRINNPTGCQVLVTVPHVLQIMLLAPSHADSWATRVKRIIFDEVHSISQAEDGVVWEQLLLLSPCPIIALSATVGNPEVFRDWLTSTQKSIGIDLEMVKHPYRYSDLRKFYYVAPEKFRFDGLGEKKDALTLGLDDVAGFEYVHPVASLVNKTAGIPDDLHLEPRDCFTLWQAMSEFSTEKFSLSDKLNPANALPDIIRKRDVLHWEGELKQVLAGWMADSSSPFDEVFKKLSGTPLPQEESYQSRKAVGEGKPQKVEGYMETTLPLLCRLHEQEALPAIFFNYDRSACEKITTKLSTDLKEAEDHWKETDPKWVNKIKAFNAWKKLQEKKDQKSAKAKSKTTDRSETGERMSKAELQRDAAGADQSAFDTFDPEAPVDGYHFADYKKIQSSELADYIGQLERRGIQPWLVAALSRGIGVHHAGMNRKYRQVVEVLFRRGFLRVVVATGTLALGINMPCKTVIFSGDSVFLTALNYRQCAGRAGRRGFDLLGNVVFQDIPRAKVARLVSSRLPDLSGHFPITTTLVLRLFTLLHGSKGSKYAVKAISTLLSQPRLYMGGPSFKDQTLHHLRFSIEYLRRQHLLDSRGATLNFSGLVSHLYFTENSSFAFHALLKEGFFHRLCADINTKEKSVVEKLMLVMAHLFGRVYTRNADAEYKEKVIKPSSSIVFLPALPEDAAQVLDEHRKQTLEIFTNYVQSFVDQHVSDADNTLPLTGIKAGASAEIETETVAGLQHASLPPTKIRSQFFALSGHSDDFKSISELCRSVRSGVFLEESAIPHVTMHSQGLELPLNAYLLDFFKHGDIDTLERSNGIRKGDVWFLLNDFSLILATIITSLMNFLKLKAGTDMDFLDTMGDLDAMEEVEDDGIAAAEEGEKAVPAVGVANPTKQPEKPFVSKKKAKNTESWEDMADEEDHINKQIDAATAKLEQQALDLDDASWEGEGGDTDLLKVLKGFQKLHAEFNIKFRAMWA